MDYGVYYDCIYNERPLFLDCEFPTLRYTGTQFGYRYDTVTTIWRSDNMAKCQLTVTRSKNDKFGVHCCGVRSILCPLLLQWLLLSIQQRLFSASKGISRNQIFPAMRSFNPNWNPSCRRAVFMAGSRPHISRPNCTIASGFHQIPQKPLSFLCMEFVRIL